MYKIIRMEKELELNQMNSRMLLKAKKIGFTDKLISKISRKSEEEIKALRKEYNILANFKMVDTCSAEFEAQTPYYYSSYDEGNEAISEGNLKKVMVLRIRTN